MDMADSPTAVMDLTVRDIARKTEPDLMRGRNPNMMLFSPETMAPNTNNLKHDQLQLRYSRVCEVFMYLADPIL